MTNRPTHRHGYRPVARTLLPAAVSLLALAYAQPAFATGVRAGTIINNTATATFTSGGAQQTITSNTVSLRVDEILDVAVASRDSADLSVSGGATGQVRSFTVTNAGNGAEAFSLAALGAVSGNNFDSTVTTVAIDSNGNGVYDAGVDQVISAGGATPSLDPDAAITVFIVSSIPGTAADGSHGSVRLTATAVTGSGAPGTVFAGQGTGGGDAVVGATHATQFADGRYAVSSAAASLVKSATVLDPFGGSRALPGAVVTYRLVASVTGSGSLAGLHVTDTAPAGTTYKPGTLTLDGTALTDAADSDAGSAGASGIDVALGNQSGGASHAVEFKVVIN